jgi:hypothetical protein
MSATAKRKVLMLTKNMSAAVLAGLLFAVSAPVVLYAGDAPKTKAECEKTKDMQWDDQAGKCEKK